jgi:hypothetical protein
MVSVLASSVVYRGFETDQVKLKTIQGNITVLATFSIARFLIFPAKNLETMTKVKYKLPMNQMKQWVILRNNTEQNSSRLIDSWLMSFEQYFYLKNCSFGIKQQSPTRSSTNINLFSS